MSREGAVLGLRGAGDGRPEDRQGVGDEHHDGRRPGILVNPLPAEADDGGRRVDGYERGAARAGHVQHGRDHGPRLGQLPDPAVSSSCPRSTSCPINNPSVGVSGMGGEGPNGFVAAAIANAVFDATGKQPRRLPLTPGYIRASARFVARAGRSIHPVGREPSRPTGASGSGEPPEPLTSCFQR